LCSRLPPLVHSIPFFFPGLKSPRELADALRVCFSTHLALREFVRERFELLAHLVDPGDLVQWVYCKREKGLFEFYFILGKNNECLIILFDAIPTCLPSWQTDMNMN
jgi:hypothetical protein